MTQSMMMIALAGFGLVALGITLLAGLRAWRGWLDLKRLELEANRAEDRQSPAIERIEMADLKERIRKLEAIAACVDL